MLAEQQAQKMNISNNQQERDQRIFNELKSKNDRELEKERQNKLNFKSKMQ